MASNESRWRKRQQRESEQRGTEPTREYLNFATDELITDHIGMARAMAYRMRARIPTSSNADVDDMIGDALFGLVVAGRTFDESYNVPFKAWAKTQIRGEVWNGRRRWTHGHKKEPPKFVTLSEVWGEEQG